MLYNVFRYAKVMQITRFYNFFMIVFHYVWQLFCNNKHYL